MPRAPHVGHAAARSISVLMTYRLSPSPPRQAETGEAEAEKGEGAGLGHAPDDISRAHGPSIELISCVVDKLDTDVGSEVPRPGAGCEFCA